MQQRIDFVRQEFVKLVADNYGDRNEEADNTISRRQSSICL